MNLSTDTKNSNWTDENGCHQGGQSCGIGFTIAWQRGGLYTDGRNGAFLLDVLEACQNQVRYFQDSKFACDENQQVLEHLESAISLLVARRDRRQESGTLGTHTVDPTERDDK